MWPILFLGLAAAETCQVSSCGSSCTVILPGCPEYQTLCANTSTMVAAARSSNDTQLLEATLNFDKYCSMRNTSSQPFSYRCTPDNCQSCLDSCTIEPDTCDECTTCVVEHVCFYNLLCMYVEQLFNGTNTQPIQTWLDPIQKECDQILGASSLHVNTALLLLLIWALMEFT